MSSSRRVIPSAIWFELTVSALPKENTIMAQRSDALESSKLRGAENRNVSRAWPPGSAIEGSSSTAVA